MLYGGVSVYHFFFNKGVDEWTDEEGTKESQSSPNPGCTSQLNKWRNLLKLAQLPKIEIKMEIEVEISQHFLGNLHSYFLHCSGNPVQIICVTSPLNPRLSSVSPAGPAHVPTQRQKRGVREGPASASSPAPFSLNPQERVPSVLRGWGEALHGALESPLRLEEFLNKTTAGSVGLTPVNL